MKNMSAISVGVVIVVVAVIVAVKTGVGGKNAPIDELKPVAREATQDTTAVSQNIGRVASPATVDPASAALPHIAATRAPKGEVDLWQVNEASPDTVFDGNPAKRLQANPSDIATLHVGQRLNLHIPQRDTALEAEIASTHNLTPQTQVWQGKVLGGHPQDNIVVTRGKIETHVTIATFDGTYSAVIDNATGDTVMVDEADIIANQVPHEDGIPVDPVNHQPPTIMP